MDMKIKFNKIVNSHNGSVNEVFLFRKMADIFNTCTSKGSYVKETHGTRGFVEYESTIFGKAKTVEIADLMFLIYNKSKKELRLSFLQAKYKKEPYNKFLSFAGNIYQRELLLQKPMINPKKTGFPCDILTYGDRKYQSITTYGIFYEDIHGCIDFFYTLPRHLHPYNDKTKNGITPFHFQGRYCCPDAYCQCGIFLHETISTCSMNVFYKQVLLGNVGAPLGNNMMTSIHPVLMAMRRSNPDNDVLNEIIELIGIDRDIRNTDEIRHIPAILILSNGNNLETSDGLL